MRRIISLASVAVAITSLSASSSLANDSVAAMGAGGLVLGESADIRMLSEDLSISAGMVRVLYEFRNESAAAISTRVAFPLPKANMEELDDLSFGRLSENPANPIDFRVKIDGQSVQPELERKATYKGEDVTAFLVQHGVSLDYPGQDFRTKLQALPPGAKQALKKRGLADFANDNPWAVWTIQHTFHWMQVFPAGRIVNVEHDYKPVVGGSYIITDGDHSVARLKAEFQRFCLDERGARGILRRVKMAKQTGKGMGTSFIDYILTTGANWKGTIGTFKLTIDKGKPGNLVSLCMNGMRRTGPTSFVTMRRNFEPKRDLSILIVSEPD